MKQKLIQRQLTQEEADLIDLMRNYAKSYPNGYPQLYWEIQELFDSLLPQPY